MTVTKAEYISSLHALPRQKTMPSEIKWKLTPSCCWEETKVQQLQKELQKQEIPPQGSLTLGGAPSSTAPYSKFTQEGRV